MNRFLCLVVLIAFGAAAGLCGTIFTWTDVGTAADINNNPFPLAASGTLIANSLGGGVYVAVSGSGVVNGETFTLHPGPGDGSDFSYGWFSANDKLYPGSTPLLDSGGLVFESAAGTVLSIYLRDSGYAAVAENGNFLWSADGTTFTLNEAVPEPSSLLLGLTAAAALLILRRRRHPRPGPLRRTLSA